MMKYLFGLLLLCICIACDQPKKPVAATSSADKQIPNHLLITPGGGIGKVTVGENAETVLKALGKPDAGDAAMGSQLMTWYDNHVKSGHRFTVFSHRENGGPRDPISAVKAIRITSPEFRTTGGAHTGVPIADVKKEFSLQRTQSSGVTIYTDSASGIAFEIDARDNCSAIIVFARGGMADTYLNMRE
ncbi:hypothetical protein QWY89_22475 [Mucilaginibacter myungsuensis]|nr:hypothetical protein [Mucilaginibacter myungsuensis]